MLRGTDRLGNPDQATPSRGETLAPLGAPVRENPAAANSGHALTETVPAFADKIAGLEGAFHGLPPTNNEPAVYGFAQAKSTPGAAFMGALKTGPFRIFRKEAGVIRIQGIKSGSQQSRRIYG